MSDLLGESEYLKNVLISVAVEVELVYLHSVIDSGTSQAVRINNIIRFPVEASLKSLQSTSSASKPVTHCLVWCGSLLIVQEWVA